jgi:hypothetical protein
MLGYDDGVENALVVVDTYDNMVVVVDMFRIHYY